MRQPQELFPFQAIPAAEPSHLQHFWHVLSARIWMRLIPLGTLLKAQLRIFFFFFCWCFHLFSFHTFHFIPFHSSGNPFTLLICSLTLISLSLCLQACLIFFPRSWKSHHAHTAPVTGIGCHQSVVQGSSFRGSVLGRHFPASPRDLLKHYPSSEQWRHWSKSLCFKVGGEHPKDEGVNVWIKDCLKRYKLDYLDLVSKNVTFSTHIVSVLSFH